MLAVVSPAKNLDYDSPVPTQQYSQPDMLEQTEELLRYCRKLSPAELSSLMSISDNLATLNANRFAEFHTPFTKNNARQAVFAFNGDVYTGLDAYSLDEAALNYAQQHLRILSGLYGLLKPLDLMQAYRLEMGTSLTTGKGKNLYEFWGNQITQKLNQAVAEQGDNVLVNLASNEYFKAVNKRALEAMIVTPVFKDSKNGQYKVISFYAKKARGMMARFLLQNQVKEVAELTTFSEGGYYFSNEHSSSTELVFLRDEPIEAK